MSLIKTFPIALILLFGSAALWLHQENLGLMQDAGKALETQYRNKTTELASWHGDGQALYQHLQQSITLQFFQYTDGTDGSRNFTTGQLQETPESFLARLFPLEISDTRNLPDGRLMVKLDTNGPRTLAVSLYSEQLIIIGSLFAASLLLFLALASTLSRKIRYAAEYVKSLTELNFSPPEQSKLGGELKPLATVFEEARQALKQKIDGLHHENEKLSRAAFQDPITGFGSRARFTRKLDELAKSQKDLLGSLAMLQATELGTINQLKGRTAGDDYLAKVAGCLRKAGSPFPDAEFYRISSSDFAVFLPNLVISDAERFLEPLKTLLDEYQSTSAMESIAYTGLVPYKSGVDPVGLLSLSDAALSIAQTLGANSFHVLEKFTEDQEIGDNRWQVAITEIITQRAVRFFQQPIQPCRSEVEVYRELFARFFNSEGKVLPTATVIAMAERHGLSQELDKLVVLSAVRMLLDNPNMTGAYGVNISAVSATDDNFVVWLKDLLTKHRAISNRLVLEINESGLQTNMQGSFRFIREIHSVGTRVSIERFGMGFTSFKFFREVRPDYIKLDATYSEAIDQDANNKFFVRMMIDIARRIGVRVIACGVERQEEKLTLEKLMVDGLQGFYIAKPEPAGSKDLLDEKLTRQS
ncbi:EAL domain-containing protein [Shewanella amazonensis]|nr:GGDEF domain-containing protein [Shewanella amazonensis]